MPEGQRPRGVTPHPRSGAAAKMSYPARVYIFTSINLYNFGCLLFLNHVVSNQFEGQDPSLNLRLLLILRLSHHPFSCPLVIIPRTRCMGLRLMITSCFPLRHMKQKLITALLWIWVLIIHQTKDTFQKFGTIEQDVYWKHNWALRVLYWLPSNFYLTLAGGFLPTKPPGKLL